MTTNDFQQLQAAIQVVSNRVDTLQRSTGTKAAWTVAIAAVSLLVSILAFFWNRRTNRAALLHQVKNTIDSAKTHMENITLQMSQLAAKSKKTADEQRQLDIMMKVHESALEKVLNAYEDGSQKYCARLVLRGEFKKSYFQDIRDYEPVGLRVSLSLRGLTAL